MRVLDDDRGAVTVEAALALCSLIAVMVMVIGAVSAASAHLRCLDAAREAVRLVSRGEPRRAREVAAAIAPRGAALDVRVAGDEVQVRVTVAAVPGIPALSLVGVAVGVMEPAAFLTAEAPPGEVSDLPSGLGGPGSDGPGLGGPGLGGPGSDEPGSDGPGSDGPASGRQGSDGPDPGAAPAGPDPAPEAAAPGASEHPP